MRLRPKTSIFNAEKTKKILDINYGFLLCNIAPQYETIQTDSTINKI